MAYTSKYDFRLYTSITICAGFNILDFFQRFNFKDLLKQFIAMKFLCSLTIL